jgi:hypothetical protein
MQHSSNDKAGPGARVRLATAASLFGAAAIIAACAGDATGIAAGSVSQIAFTTGVGAAADASLSTAPVTVGTHTLDLTTATITISRAELKASTTNVCPGDQDGDDDNSPPQTPSTQNCGELKIGPTTVDLPLTGTLATIPANVIPAGTYQELELRVSQVELKGTFDGKAFDVTVPVQAKSEIEFSTPLVVTADAAPSITVNVPVSTWLVNADGSLVDPSTLLTTPSLLQQVRNRIAASFRAFEDRDHDGKDDHGGGSDHGGNGHEGPGHD